VRWEVRDPSTGKSLGTAAYTVDLTPMGDRYGAWAMRVTMADCCAAESRSVEVQLVTEDASGETATITRRVTTSSCSVCRQ
jgi:hypothetical protein